MLMDIKKIVVTGGPCAGKSTAMAKIKEELEREGYTVLLVHETATELISGGPAALSQNIKNTRCFFSLKRR